METFNMEDFNTKELKNLYKPSKDSHKGQNGKLMIIGGSYLFHGASLWTLKVASRIVDMVFYSSIPENNELTQRLKGEIYDFIAIPREEIEEYIVEADAVLIGPGMVRNSKFIHSTSSGQNSKLQFKIQNLREIEDEGDQTYYLTKYLLQKYPNKKWVIDAGALTEMELEQLKQLSGNVILTPHHREFQMLFNMEATDENVLQMTKDYNCVILLKGATDIVCGSFDFAQDETRCIRVSGGNEGMTKGGTGDVLAGLVAALACKNDLFLAAKAGSFINKYAGDNLYKKSGHYFNASDLMDEIPKAMKELLL